MMTEVWKHSLKITINIKQKYIEEVVYLRLSTDENDHDL